MKDNLILHTAEVGDILYKQVLYSNYITSVEYTAIRVTKCGVWIADLSTIKGRRFINLLCEKQFACQTEELAAKEFIRRKTIRNSILSSEIRINERALSIVTERGYCSHVQIKPEGFI